MRSGASRAPHDPRGARVAGAAVFATPGVVDDPPRSSDRADRAEAAPTPGLEFRPGGPRATPPIRAHSGRSGRSESRPTRRGEDGSEGRPRPRGPGVPIRAAPRAGTRCPASQPPGIPAPADAGFGTEIWGPTATTSGTRGPPPTRDTRDSPPTSVARRRPFRKGRSSTCRRPRPGRPLSRRGSARSRRRARSAPRSAPATGVRGPESRPRSGRGRRDRRSPAPRTRA